MGRSGRFSVIQPCSHLIPMANCEFFGCGFSQEVVYEDVNGGFNLPINQPIECVLVHVKGRDGMWMHTICDLLGLGGIIVSLTIE